MGPHLIRTRRKVLRYIMVHLSKVNENVCCFRLKTEQEIRTLKKDDCNTSVRIYASVPTKRGTVWRTGRPQGIATLPRLHLWTTYREL